MPPAPLYLAVERAPARFEPRVEVITSDNVTSITVTVDLTRYNEQDYSARIVAGWVQPSPDNRGLERWKVGISALDIHNDHDPFPFDDGDWIFWAAINNRDQEWTRLLNGGDVTGKHTFGGRPFETGLPPGDRSLGPHLLLFYPRLAAFPGLPLEELNQSLLIHTSGYDAELFDDPTGVVNDLGHLGTLSGPVGDRYNFSRRSDTSDYTLNYFVERVGPVLPNLSAAGQALALTYSLRPQQALCERVPTTACVLFPEGESGQGLASPSGQAAPRG